MPHPRHRPAAAAVAVLAVLLGGCAPAGTTYEPIGATSGATDATPVDVGRVVVLGEEFALADVLALGVEPVASTATVATGFQGIEADTSDIEVLSATETDLERIAELDPDLLVVYPYLVDVIGRDTLEQLGELVVLPDEGFRADVRTMADAFGVPARAEELFAEYDRAVATAAAALPDDLEVSLVTVYAGDNLAIWADGPVNVPATMVDAGIALSPDASSFDDLDDNGRAHVSVERLDDLDGDVVVTLQTSTVPGEDTSLAALTSTDLWAAVPAVREGRVVELDRLGYPGVQGRIRLADELPDLLGGASSPITGAVAPPDPATARPAVR